MRQVRNKARKCVVVIRIIGLLICTSSAITLTAGPPFFTDDPDPVPFHHWEYYLSSENIFDLRSRSATGTLPHVEVNYGVIPNVQLHLVLPTTYLFSSPLNLEYGYTYTEVGVKFRFVKEKKDVPEIGVFPIVEIPTVNDPRFGEGNIQVYLPVWIQKSWGNLTTYGGAGYWINPGSGNNNWVYTGWEVQYGFTKFFTLGSELYFHTAATKDANSVSGFTIGGFLNFTENIHFIFSVGHTITGENQITSYAGLYITI